MQSQAMQNVALVTPNFTYYRKQST